MSVQPPPPTSAAARLYSLILQNRLKNRSNNSKPDNDSNSQPHSAIPLAGVHDPLSARIFAQKGAPALFLSGFGVSATHLGKPDAGITTLSEMEMVARHTCAAVGQEEALPPPPIIVDGDTGYGGSGNMLRTISSLASAGAAAISIEDQAFPKKCTIAAGSKIRIVDREVAVQRVRASLGARDLYCRQSCHCSETYSSRSSSSLSWPVWIVARTDCRAAFGFQEVIERCLLFEEMGAEIVYAENLQSLEEYQKLREKLHPSTVTMLAQVQETKQSIKTKQEILRPEKSNFDENKKRLLTVQEISQLGYDLALFGVTPLQCVVGALEMAADEFLHGENGDATGIIGHGETTSPSAIPMADFETLKRVVGFDQLEDFESKFPCE